MATPKVLLKRSSVVGNAPSASDLEYGELAINFADGKIYFKDNSNAIKAFVDSARVEAIAASVGGSIDSAGVIALIDAAYVQARQDKAYSSLTGAPTNVSDFTNDAGYITTAENMLDSAEAIALIDSAHVQLRQTPQNFAYAALTGAPTLISLFTNDTNYLDSSTVTGVINATYIQANQIQYNTSNFVDSAYVEANSLDSERTTNLIDSSYVQSRVTAGTDSAATISLITSTIDSAYVNLRADQYNNFDTDFAAKSTSDLSEGSNLYYTKARADSDIAASLNDSTNTVNITINNTITDTVDSAYVLARVNEAPFLDSANAIQLIDSAYIQARQVDLQRDSGFVTNIIDSAYIQLRDTPQDFAYASLTGAPSIPVSGTDFADSAWITLQINNLIDGAPGTLNTLNEIAAALNDDDSAYNTLIGLIAAKTDFDSAAAIALIDSDYIELRRPAESIFNVTSSGSSAYTFNGDGFSSSANNPTLYLTRGKTYKFAMAASGHPFQIRVSNGGSAYNAGVTNNGLQTGNILFTPDMNAPTSLVYQCTIHSGMVGNIVILDDTDAIGLDSALATQLIDSAYIQLRDTPQDFAYGSLTGTPTIPVTGTDFADSAWILGQIPKVGVDYVDSAYVASVLPKTGVDFADSSWIVANFLDSALTTQLIDSAYIQDRQAGGGGGTVDSAYVESVSLDSERTQLLIDSAYIQLRQTSGGGTFALAGNTGTHTFNTATETLTFLGTTGQINAGIASNNVTLALDQNINSITSIAFEGDSANAHETKVQAVNPTKDNTISLPDSSGTIALLTDITTGGGGTTDSATVLALIDSAHVQARQSIEAASPLLLTNLIYIADSGQTSFTGVDRNGTTLAVDSGKLQVFLNGILLSDSDFSHNASKVDLTVAADSADILTVVKIGGNSGVSGFQQKHFIYNADSGQTVFTGAATSGEVLSYSNFNRTNVYLNGIMLISGTDYTATNGTTVTLIDAADSGDVLDINTFIGSNIGIDSSSVIQLIDSAYVTARAGAGTDSAAVIQLIDSAYVVARAGASTDSATVLNLIDSAHIALKAIGLDYGILANRPTIPVTGTDFADSAWITAQIDALIDGAPGTLNTLNEIAAALNDDDSAYGTLLTLINAKSDVDSVGSLSNVTYGVPTAGQILKYDAGTSKFILATDAGGLDSSLTSQLVDSAYVQARGTGSAPFELTNFIYTADSGQVTFTGADNNSRTLAIDSGKLQVFLNGILLSDADFSHNATKVDLTIAADSADILTIVKMDGNNSVSNFQSKHFIYNADSGQTAFTGAATSGEVLAYSNADRTNVYLNGIMLINGTDFTATNGSTLTLIDAADSGDVLDINVFKGSNVSLDSASAINLIDSAYVAARAGAGTDSATVLNLIDSAHVNLHAVGLSYTRLTNTPTIPGLSTHFIDSAEAIKLITANAIDSSIAIQLLLDSAETINLIDSAHVQLHAVGLSYNRLTNLPSIPVTGTDFADSAYIHSVLPKTGVDFADSSWIIANFLDSALTTQLIDSDYVKLRVTKSDLDMEGNKVLFANVYDSVGSLPSATTYHGMFAHVHATGAGYFAHGGNWIRLANQSELSSAGLDSALTTQLIDSAYVQLRQSAGGGGSGTVDSAYVEANSLDSERTLLLIDSDYILARVTNTQPGEFNTDRTEFTVGGADSGRRVFDTNNTLSLVSGNTDVFLNGILQVSGTDYTIDSSAVTFTSGVAANHQVTVLERAGKVITQRGLVENVFAFTTATPATSITGTDDKGATLDVSEGYADVFLNGILLRDSDDYTINAAGTTLTLVSATDSSDIVTVKNSKGVIVTPQVKRFEYTTATPATTISGSDLHSNTLAYVPGSLQVHLNGILLQEASDFTASTGNSIVLTTATDSADDVTVSAFSAPGSKLELYKFTADSGQTVFSGNDTANRFMSYEPGNIQVFLNGLLLNDSDDYTASNTKAVRLLTAAALNDELKVASFETTSEITRSNTWTAPSGVVSAAAGDKLFIDTSGGARTVTLPSSATMGDEIRIIDVTGNAGTNNITVSRNGHKIQGAASDLVINIARAGTGLAYYNATQGWVLIEN